MTTIRFHVSDPLNKIFGLPTENLLNQRAILQDAWQRKEGQIIAGLEQITGLHFLQNPIDVFLVDPTTSRAISHPIIIGTKGPEDKFIRILTHELIHKLAWDNQEGQDWYLIMERLLPDETRHTAYHVMIHAVLSKLYETVLKDSQAIMDDIAMCNGMPDLKRAWEIVQSKGCDQIVKGIKSNGSTL